VCELPGEPACSSCVRKHRSSRAACGKNVRASGKVDSAGQTGFLGDVEWCPVLRPSSVPSSSNTVICSFGQKRGAGRDWRRYDVVVVIWLPCCNCTCCLPAHWQRLVRYQGTLCLRSHHRESEACCFIILLLVGMSRFEWAADCIPRFEAAERHLVLISMLLLSDSRCQSQLRWLAATLFWCMVNEREIPHASLFGGVCEVVVHVV
jgi:hypothetical protein